jgi:predicted small lipoprotein YifL
LATLRNVDRQAQLIRLILMILGAVLALAGCGRWAI